MWKIWRGAGEERRDCVEREKTWTQSDGNSFDENAHAQKTHSHTYARARSTERFPPPPHCFRIFSSHHAQGLFFAVFEELKEAALFQHRADVTAFHSGGFRCCAVSDKHPLGTVGKAGQELYLPCCLAALIISCSDKHNNGKWVEVVALLG